MGLWLKQDGKMVEVSGGGSFDGEHVPTGDPTDPASLDLVDEGQLLWDGVEGSSGGGGDSVGGSIQYHSIGTSGVTGIEATEVDLPIVDVYGGPLVVGQEYVVSAEGSFRFGVGATSFVSQAVNINGSRVIECMAYRTFIDNERFMVSASISWDCDDANPTVTVVASCSVGSMQTYNTDARRANVTFTPMQSSGGGGDAGPHDHDYLPLSGGTLTGSLGVAGQINVGDDFNVSGINVRAGYVRHSDGDYSWPSISFENDKQAGFYLAGPQQVAMRGELQVDGLLQVNENICLAGGQSDSKITKNRGTDRSSIVIRSSDDDGSARLVLYGGNDNSGFKGYARMMIGDAVGAEWNKNGEVFQVAEGVDTADVLDSADGANPVSVREVVTALLAKVKELSAEIEELKGN